MKFLHLLAVPPWVTRLILAIRQHFPQICSATYWQRNYTSDAKEFSWCKDGRPYVAPLSPCQVCWGWHCACHQGEGAKKLDVFVYFVAFCPSRFWMAKFVNAISSLRRLTMETILVPYRWIRKDLQLLGGATRKWGWNVRPTGRQYIPIKVNFGDEEYTVHGFTTYRQIWSWWGRGGYWAQKPENSTICQIEEKLHFVGRENHPARWTVPSPLLPCPSRSSLSLSSSPFPLIICTFTKWNYSVKKRAAMTKFGD